MKLCTGVIDITVTVATPKKNFTSLFSLLGVILGVFLSPFWPKILKCSQQIEEYSYVPRFFWEPFNIFSWNFVQVFLVLLSLHYFFFISSWRRSFSAAGHYFFHEIFDRCSRYYSSVATLKRFFTWSCSLLLLTVILGYILNSVHYFFKKFMQMFLVLLWQLLNLNVFLHHVPLCWEPFGGDILGSFGYVFPCIEKISIFLMIFCAEPLFNTLMVTKQKITVGHLPAWYISGQFKSVFLKYYETI